MLKTYAPFEEIPKSDLDRYLGQTVYIYRERIEDGKNMPVRANGPLRYNNSHYTIEFEGEEIALSTSEPVFILRG